MNSLGKEIVIMRDYRIKRPPMKTTKKQIVDWCMKNIDECHYPVDASEMHSHCFRCGYQRATEKAHTVPWAKYNYDSKYDSPQYYRLLCSECHPEAPNVMEEIHCEWPNHHSIMDKWIIKSAKEFNGHLHYNTYWEHRNKFYELLDKTGQHGFEPMNKATMEWIMDEMLKWKEGLFEDYCKERGLDYESI